MYNVKVTNRTVFTGMVQVRLIYVSFFIAFPFVPQGISQIVNPSRMIGYNRVGIACTPNIVFTGESFEVTLPDDADSEETFTMCVQLIFGNCMELKSIDFTSKSNIFNVILYLPPMQYLVEPSLHRMEEWCWVLLTSLLL